MTLTLAAAEFELTGRLDSAMTLLAEAEGLAGQSGSESLVATIRGQRGLLLLRGGRVEQALAALDAAVDVIDDAEPGDQMVILLNRGTAHMERGSLEVARADLEYCVEVAALVGDRSHEMKARHNLGYVEFLAGRIPRALAAMEGAAALSRGDAHPISLLDQARVLREAGLTSEAAALLTRAADLFAERRLGQDVAEAQLVHAECALVEDDAAQALALARRAERAFARRGNTLWRRRAQMLVLRCERRALDESAPRRLRALATRARRLADDCRRERRRDLARAAALLATECDLRAGTRPEAVAPALPAVRATDPLQTRLQAREVRALVALRRGQRARAAGEVRHGLDDLGVQASRFGSLDLRTASAVHGVSLARIGLDVAEQGGSAAELFAAIERGRAISTRLARIGPPTDERTARLLSELRRCEEEARVREGDPAAAPDVARLRRDVARLQRDIRSRAWELEGDREPPSRSSARAGEVRDAARAAGSAFVSFVVHRGRCLGVVASARRPRVVVLAPVEQVEELVRRVRADLDALAMPRLPSPLAGAVRRSLDAGLARLDALLLGPLGVEGTPLLLCCGPSLGLLPWSLLPSRRGLPVVVTPSATAWLHAGSGGRRGRPRVLSVAGPGLLRADQEAEQVGSLWPDAELLTGARATAGAGREGLAHADVVHVAAHGTHQQESPLFSSLRMADGPLYAYELDAEGGAAPCVVLSACEAGLATVRPGDEGLGLTSVLLHLGSRSVLAGVARVADDVAARVMADVHRAMSRGTASAEALAEALAAEPTPAPFVVFGGSW
jgi:tetratricopeptide (TPR) repeat protein